MLVLVFLGGMMFYCFVVAVFTSSNDVILGSPFS